VVDNELPVLQILPAPPEGENALVLEVNQAFFLSFQATYKAAGYPLQDPLWLSSNATIVSASPMANGCILIPRQQGEALISLQAYGALGLITAARNITVINNTPPPSTPSDDPSTPSPEDPSGSGSGNSLANTPSMQTPSTPSTQPTAYFTLTGLPLGHTPPTRPGIYLSKKDGFVTKLLVR
jgi:hypothetical protein